MKTGRFLTFILILFTLVRFKSFAQDAGKQSLDTFLFFLEGRFNVVFTYADENIQGIHITIQKRDLTLDEYLFDLEEQTKLSFKRLDSRYIAIKKKNNAVSINGTIKDKFTGQLLIGAVIFSNKSLALSDKNGRFSIKVNPETDSALIIRHVGYKPLILNKNTWVNDSSVYVLTPDVYALNEVVINYIATGLDKMEDGSIQLNVQNLNVLPGLSEPDVLRTVQVLPGIQSINETVSDINTRGGTNDQNLILWDGVKMYQTGHFFGLISAFNSHLIHKAKVVKNGTSASLGEGVSGTIDLRQQDYLVKDFGVDVGLNMISADAIVKIPFNNNLSLIFGARHSINDIAITPTYKRYYERAFEQTEISQHHHIDDTVVDEYKDFSFYDLSTKLLYDISDKDKIRFSVLHVNNKIEYEESEIVRDTLKSKKSSLKQSSLLSDFCYTRSWNSNHETSLSAYVSNYLLDAFNASLVNDQHHLQKNEVLDWGLKVNSQNRISETTRLLSGYHYSEVGIRNLDNIHKPNYSRDIKDVLRIHSLYSEAETNQLFKKLYLRLGLRANYFPKFKKLLIEPRAVLNYVINRNLSLELLAEKKSQQTTQQIDFQSDFLGIEKRRWVLSNDNSVPVIKSNQLSLGLQYKLNNFLISAEAYSKEVRGIISPSQGFQNQYQYVYAIGNYNAVGIEFLVDKQFNQSNIWINYSLARNDYNFKDFTPSTFPNNLDVRHALSLGGNYSFKNFEISSGFNYRTGKPFTKPLQENQTELGEIKYENTNSSRLNDYIRLDVSAKYIFNFRKVQGEIGVSVWNVLNRQNDINIFYQRNNQKEIEQVIQHALRTTPNINLRLRF
ncbi:TonB-dependent receptor [Labilibacter sediminis]|nr:TonB-dependent receptor [Labilibacter sediminis]